MRGHGKSRAKFSRPTYTERSRFAYHRRDRLMKPQRMDELIFQEFKGMETWKWCSIVRLAITHLSGDRYFPFRNRVKNCFATVGAGKINLIRRGLAGHKPGEAIERLLMFVKKFPTNTEMLKAFRGSAPATLTRFRCAFARSYGGCGRTKKGNSAPTSKLSTPGIQDAVMAAIASANIQFPCPAKRSTLVAAKANSLAPFAPRFGLRTTAVIIYRYADEGFHPAVDIVDLNAGKLPYLDVAFGLVTCVETSNTRTMRSSSAKSFASSSPVDSPLLPRQYPDLRSRLRYLMTGFQSFWPAPIGDRGFYNPAGTSIPSAIFILATLARNWLVDIQPSVDHYQRRSWVPFCSAFSANENRSPLLLAREKNKFRTITPENRDLVAAINSRDLLLGRTLIVCARKPM